MERIKWKDKRIRFCVYRFHRYGTHCGFLKGPHTHNGFAEVCWIEEGTAVHLINGKRVTLPQGSLEMIRERDRHGYQPAPGKAAAGFTLVNVSFPLDTLAFLRRRYFSKETRFFWASSKLPYQCALTTIQLGWLQQWSFHLAKAPTTALEIERFLLDLICELAAHEARDRHPSPPEWLSHALRQIRDPRHFLRGSHELARLAGRSPEHVTRVLKAHLGITATDAVNQARLDYAAGLLRNTTNKIIVISLECGFTGLGHFYRTFHKHFGVTPRVYREQHQTVICG